MYSNTQHMLESGIGKRVAAAEKRVGKKGYPNKGVKRGAHVQISNMHSYDVRGKGQGSSFTKAQAKRLEAFLVRNLFAGMGVLVDSL